MRDLGKAVEDMQVAVEAANLPVDLGCCKVNCSRMACVDLFQKDDQMEAMLEKNFDGVRLSAPSFDGQLLDCMFMPFNNDSVVVADKHDEGEIKTYMKHPTIILFNQNAQTYQQQVHSPNCFWLKYFISANVNVMTWNYRSYGKSGGTPDPFTCMHDAEAVLKFTIKKLGLRGKIGVFGRSLGGTFATHLAANYPQHVDFLMVDRSFSSLEAMARNALPGSLNNCLLDFFSRGWVLNSARNFYKA